MSASKDDVRSGGVERLGASFRTRGLQVERGALGDLGLVGRNATGTAVKARWKGGDRGELDGSCRRSEGREGDENS